jgi:TrkA-C domain
VNSVIGITVASPLVTGVFAVLGAVLVLALILRVGTAALAVTGLSREVARFQTRSAFFGVGFTTAEAESIVNHPVRRRIVSTLMLLGAIGITGVIGSVVLTLARSGDSIVGPIAGLVIGLAILWLIWSWKALDRAVVRRIEWLLRRYTKLDTHDYAALLRVSGEWSVRAFDVHPGGPLDGRTLAQLDGLVVLGIQRADGSYEGAPAVGSTLAVGDTLTVYGRDDVLAGLSR